MKKILLAITILITMFVSCSNGNKSSDVIKVGVPLPLTGDVAQYGVAIKEGIQLHVDQINAEGGINGKKLEVDYQDTKGDIQEAINIFKKMASNKVDVIIGEAISSNTLAISELAQKAQIPLIAPTATAFDVTKDKDYVFRVTFTDPYQGVALAKYLKKEGYTDIALLKNTSNDYSIGVSEALKKQAEADGLKVYEETYTKDDKDFKTVLTKIKNASVKAVVIPDYYNTIGLILSQAKEIGLEANYFGGDGWDGIQESFANLAEGAVFASQFTPEDDSSIVQDFIAKYKEKFSKEPIIFSALGYDSVSLLKEALSKSDNIKDGLKNIEMDLITGHLKFDENRNPVKKVIFITVKDGKLKLKEKFGE